MNAKPFYTFHFIDQPQYKTGESRAYLANALRAFRKQSARYELTRLENGYLVQVRGTAAVGLFERHI